MSGNPHVETVDENEEDEGVSSPMRNIANAFEAQVDRTMEEVRNETTESTESPVVVQRPNVGTEPRAEDQGQVQQRPTMVDYEAAAEVDKPRTIEIGSPRLTVPNSKSRRSSMAILRD